MSRLWGWDVDGHVLLNMKGHKGEEYPCRQCEDKATTKGSLTQHQRTEHEGVKYYLRQCNHQATSKVHLVWYQGAVHEGVDYP